MVALVLVLMILVVGVAVVLGFGTDSRESGYGVGDLIAHADRSGPAERPSEGTR